MKPLRLGGPIHAENPEQWISALQSAGYSAAYCPVDHSADGATIADYARAAQQADILIAEVGIWNNPISRDDAERKAAIEKCEKRLALADEIGALCTVNLSGSCNVKWNKPHPDNLTPATFDLIVETVQRIIDTVKPKRTFYTLEPMPWIYPDSIESYDALIKAIDRPQFAVHYDPTNLINSPSLYYHNAAFMREFVEKLGSHIKSVHIKDVIMTDDLIVHLEEVRPGLGTLDYGTLLRTIHALPGDVPVMLEHLPQEEYPPAAAYVREQAAAFDVPLR